MSVSRDMHWRAALGQLQQERQRRTGYADLAQHAMPDGRTWVPAEAAQLQNQRYLIAKCERDIYCAALTRIAQGEGDVMGLANQALSDASGAAA